MEQVGLEPTMPEAADLQSAGVTNFPTTPVNQEVHIFSLGFPIP